MKVIVTVVKVGVKGAGIGAYHKDATVIRINAAYIFRKLDGVEEGVRLSIANKKRET